MMKAKRCPKTFLITAISFALAACMLVPKTAHALSFSDVSETTPHADHITWLAQQNITTGYSNSTFRPMTPVYRQDMAAFLYRLAGEPSFTPSASDRAMFKDVDASTPHAEAIWWLASTGISSGYPDGTFRPMAEVVRQDMAAFLRRLATAMGDIDAALWVPQSTSTFPDVNENTYHWEDILWLAETDISTGYPDGSFKPGATVVRQDMAAFLHRLYDHVQSHNPSQPDITEPTESVWNGCRIILAPSSCGCEAGQVIGYTDGGAKIQYDSPGVYIASIPNDMKTLSVPEYIDGLPVIAVNLSEPIDGDKTNLTSIDARNAKQLQYLQVTENMLSSVLISGLSSLETLEIRNCPLASIDLNGCSKLCNIFIECTLISALDLSHCPNLSSLICSQSKLTMLDISPCPNLSYLSCYGNYISDTSQLEQWLQLSNHSGKVTPQLELDERVRLETSDGYTYIVVESGSGVTWGDILGQTGDGAFIYYRGSGAYIIDIPATETLSVPPTIQGHTVRSITLGKAYGMINTVDAQNASGIACIELTCPNLDTLHIQGLGQLETLNVRQTRLREMDLTGCENLGVLVGTQNRLTSLDLSSTSKLSVLFVSNNQLTSLDISPCSGLSQLECKYNRIADTSALEAWLEQEGHSGSCLPQDA